jgi:hypothetical protein
MALPTDPNDPAFRAAIKRFFESDDNGATFRRTIFDSMFTPSEPVGTRVVLPIRASRASQEHKDEKRNGGESPTA